MVPPRRPSPRRATPPPDISLSLGECSSCTLRKVIIDVNFDRGRENGHHGIALSRGRDNLLTDCMIKAKQVGELSCRLRGPALHQLRTCTVAYAPTSESPA